MFTYRELYLQIGNLMYAVATADGHISKQEREAVQELIMYNWKHLETGKDEFGEDMSNLIFYQFDIDEGQLRTSENAYHAFEKFYHQHDHEFNDLLREKMLTTVRRIAESTRRINDKELVFLMRLRQMFQQKHAATQTKKEKS